MVRLLLLCLGLALTAGGDPSSPCCGKVDWSCLPADSQETRYVPWQAAIIRVDMPHWHPCGGAVINNRYVLTSAFCVYFEKKPYQVLVAEQHSGAGPHVQRRHDVTKVIKHPMYRPWTYDRQGYDLALVKLATSISFADGRVVPVCLPDGGGDFIGVDARFSRWKNFPDRPQTFELLESPMRTLTKTECKKLICEKFYPKGSPGCKNIYKSTYKYMLCAATTDGSTAHHHTPGGPLVTEVAPGRYHLIGLQHVVPGTATQHFFIPVHCLSI